MSKEDSHERAQRSGGHQRWLAMQSAYLEYKRASEALEYLPLSGDASNDARLLRGIIQDRQRLAFERYLEARMQFLEFRFDESQRRRGHGLSLVRRRIPGNLGIGSWSAFSQGRWMLSALAAVVMLCAAGFYFAHQHNRVRELEAARNELWAELNQAQDEARTPTYVAFRKAAYTPPEPSRRAAQMVAPKRASKVEPAVGIQVQTIGAHTYYAFSLEPSQQFRRVGPIQILLRSVVGQRSYVSLSITTGPAKLNVQRLRLSQPLWIGDGQRQQPLELIVDRVAGNRMYGRVIEAREKSNLRASRAKTGPSWGP